MVSNEQINLLTARVAKLEQSINIEQRRIDLQNEQERTEEPTFWDNPDEARKQLKKVADIKAVIEEWKSAKRVAGDLELVADFVAEGDTNTEVKVVWRLLLALNGDRRTMRCTPLSERR